MLDEIINTSNAGYSPLAKIPARKRKKVGYDEKSPQEYLLAHATAIENLNKDAEDELVRLWVRIIRRQRGATLSDNIGDFHPRLHTWIDVNVSAFRPINIVKPAVRANTATMSQANVALKIEPSRPAMKGAASVTRGLYDYFDTVEWKETLETRVADLAQMSSAAFLWIEERDSEFTQKIPSEIETSIQMSGVYACPSCGLEAEYEPEPNKETATCRQCGLEAEQISSPEESFIPKLGFSEARAKDCGLTVVSPFEVRMDRRKTQGGDFHKGKYFERRSLKTRRDLAAEVPHFKSAAPTTPCYALRWQHALENNLQKIRDVWYDSKTGQRDEDEFEVREIYLKPSEYQTYEAPEYHAWRDDETNEVIFDIRIGETWEQAVLRNNPDAERKKGICFWITDKKIVKPPFFADFCAEYPAQIQFDPDAYSVWAQPFSIILSINDDVTSLNTIMMLHLEKNSIANIVVDTGMFDFEDFERDFVPTRERMNMANDDIRRHFAVLEPPKLGGEAVSYMGFQLGMSNNLSGVQPAALGAAQPGQPYAAQLLQVNQSQGLMTSYYKSKAQGKVSAFRAWLKYVQRIWSEEQFAHVASAYGEEWRDSDLEDFYNCDLDRDLLISYVAGSEIPKTLQQREVKLQNFFMQIGQLMQVPGAVTPQMLQELISEMADQADFNFDFGNYEGERRLARARLELLKEACKLFTQTGFSFGVNEQGRSTAPLAARQIIAQAQCMPNAKSENHETQKEFWADQCRALAADPLADEVLAAVCNEMIVLHEESEVQLGQENTVNQIKINAPAEEYAQFQQQKAQQAQLAAQIQQTQGQLASAQEEGATEDEDKEREYEERQSDREQQDAHKLLDIADNEAQRQHEREMNQQNG